MVRSPSLGCEVPGGLWFSLRVGWVELGASSRGVRWSDSPFNRIPPFLD